MRWRPAFLCNDDSTHYSAAAEVVERVRAERTGPLTFTIDGGCCEGAAPHLYEHAVITATARHVADVSGVPVYLQAAMSEPYENADVVIDVVDEPLSEAMSLETGFGVRFVLREAAAETGRVGCPSREPFR